MPFLLGYAISLITQFPKLADSGPKVELKMKMDITIDSGE